MRIRYIYMLTGLRRAARRSTRVSRSEYLKSGQVEDGCLFAFRGTWVTAYTLLTYTCRG